MCLMGRIQFDCTFDCTELTSAPLGFTNKVKLIQTHFLFDFFVGPDPRSGRPRCVRLPAGRQGERTLQFMTMQLMRLH
jgi:hypothetical protein